MKRRTFLQATLIATPAVPALAADRLHGVPGSVSGAGKASALRFSLPLSRSGVPVEFWTQLDALGRCIQDAMTSPAQGRALHANPATYLRAHGLDASDATLADESVRLAVALSDPHVKRSLATRDYARLFTRLGAAGLIDRRAPSMLQAKLESALASNAATIRQLLVERTATVPSQQNGMLALLQDGTRTVTIDDLAAARDLLLRGANLPARMAAVVSIVAVVVTVVIAVMIAVVVAIPVWAYGIEPMRGAAKLEPTMMDNYQRLSRVAAITGDTELAKHAIETLVRDESAAIIGAMESIGLIRIHPSRRKETIEALAAYARKAAMP
jgi:type IV secretory pathway TrbD component